MKNSLRSNTAFAVIALALGACASNPAASPRLIAAETALVRAKADADTMQSGRASLEKAETALGNARENYMDGKEDDYIHTIRMGEGYIALAEARGMQTAANRKIESLNADRANVVSQARTRQVNVAEAATADAEARATQSQIVAAGAIADSAISDAARLAAEARASALSEELASYEQTKTALGVTLILRDLQFASASSNLTSGAQGRLAPLASFLAKQPDTRIQIAGHTDSQGSEDYNRELSSQRAAAVGAYLISTGVDASRITSVGLGESTPVSTNATAAGRAINRRVEVTILD